MRSWLRSGSRYWTSLPCSWVVVLSLASTLASVVQKVFAWAVHLISSMDSIWGLWPGRLQVWSGSWWLGRWRSSEPWPVEGDPASQREHWHQILHYTSFSGPEWPHGSSLCFPCWISLLVLQPSPWSSSIPIVSYFSAEMMWFIV